MNQQELLDILQVSYRSEDYSDAIDALDVWEGKQPRDRDTLSFLRFHRQQLEQLDEAIIVAKEMLCDADTDTPTKMCDQLELCKMLLKQKDCSGAWESLEFVLSWNELAQYYEVGMTRDAIEYCMSIAIMSSDDKLMKSSFGTGLKLLNDGGSVSPVGLRKAKLAAIKLRRQKELEHCLANRNIR